MYFINWSVFCTTFNFLLHVLVKLECSTFFSVEDYYGIFKIGSVSTTFNVYRKLGTLFFFTRNKFTRNPG